MRAAALLAAIVLAGCGDGGGTTDAPIDSLVSESPGVSGSANDVVQLTRRLPPGADGYSAVDVAAVKDGLGMSDSADPIGDTEVFALTSPALSGIFTSNPEKKVVAALDLSEATAFAGSPDRQYEFVTAVETDADEADLRESLRKLGFLENQGVLEGPYGVDAIAEPPQTITSEVGAAPTKPERFEHRPIAIRFFDGGFLVSNSRESLRRLGSVADELPAEALEGMDGEMVFGRDGGSDCVRSQGLETNMDGSGRVIFVIDGAPEPAGFSPEGSDPYGEPTVAGERLIVPLETDGPESPRQVIADTLPGYDC